ncbi:uncharacterized protein PHACADRAFT_33600 [Phanerochaete carnosa HHB-10118-sp]|uniref:Uncharacterized protein n=1 Tax=Phanerochaete carnosa (strain HHB-10118-sp) TaxID=650164 RepID=K5WG28_PHACS|nr:uncharacterized protein PHACADRAFT_33600 [Phanerochaete carnosa HHB-10118-sp]EKM49157.1 hypothetical protein PHACADRAFT_33600 [Phanerochaete carnosa HHB-10118-sp]
MDPLAETYIGTTKANRMLQERAEQPSPDGDDQANRPTTPNREPPPTSLYQLGFTGHRIRSMPGTESEPGTPTAARHSILEGSRLGSLAPLAEDTEGPSGLYNVGGRGQGPTTTHGIEWPSSANNVPWSCTADLPIGSDFRNWNEAKSKFLQAIFTLVSIRDTFYVGNSGDPNSSLADPAWATFFNAMSDEVAAVPSDLDDDKSMYPGEAMHNLADRSPLANAVAVMDLSERVKVYEDEENTLVNSVNRNVLKLETVVTKSLSHVDTQLKLIEAKLSRVSAQASRSGNGLSTTSGALRFTKTTMPADERSHVVGEKRKDAFSLPDRAPKRGKAADGATTVRTAESLPPMPSTFTMQDVSRCTPIVTTVLEAGYDISFEAAKILVEKFGDVSQRRAKLIQAHGGASTGPIKALVLTAATAAAEHAGTQVQATLDGGFYNPATARAAEKSNNISKALNQRKEAARSASATHTQPPNAHRKIVRVQFTNQTLPAEGTRRTPEDIQAFVATQITKIGGTPNPVISITYRGSFLDLLFTARPEEAIVTRLGEMSGWFLNQGSEELRNATPWPIVDFYKPIACMNIFGIPVLDAKANVKLTVEEVYATIVAENEWLQGLILDPMSAPCMSLYAPVGDTCTVQVSIIDGSPSYVERWITQRKRVSFREKKYTIGHAHPQTFVPLCLKCLKWGHVGGACGMGGKFNSQALCHKCSLMHSTEQHQAFCQHDECKRTRLETLNPWVENCPPEHAKRRNCKAWGHSATSTLCPCWKLRTQPDKLEAFWKREGVDDATIRALSKGYNPEREIRMEAKRLGGHTGEGDDDSDPINQGHEAKAPAPSAIADYDDDIMQTITNSIHEYKTGGIETQMEEIHRFAMKYVFVKENMDNYRLQLTTMWPPTFLFFEEFVLPVEQTSQVVPYVPNMYDDNLARGNNANWVPTRPASPSRSPTMPGPPALEFELPIVQDDNDPAWKDVPTYSPRVGPPRPYQPRWGNRAGDQGQWVDLARLEWRFEDAIHKQQRGVRLSKAMIIDPVVNSPPPQTNNSPSREKFDIPLHYAYLLKEVVNGAIQEVEALEVLQGGMDPLNKGKVLDDAIETRLHMVGATTVTARSDLADLIEAAMYDRAIKRKDAFVLLEMAKQAIKDNGNSGNDPYPVVSLPFTSHLGPVICSPTVECAAEITEALGPNVQWQCDGYAKDEVDPELFGEHDDNMDGECAW